MLGLRMPVFLPTAPAILHVPRLYSVVNWDVTDSSVLSRIRVRGSCWAFSAPQAVFRSWCRLRVVTCGSLASCTPSTICWCPVFGVDFLGPCAQVQGRERPCPQGHGPPQSGAPTSGHGETRWLSHRSEPQPPQPPHTHRHDQSRVPLSLRALFLVLFSGRHGW